jgi:hypothetical protein
VEEQRGALGAGTELVADINPSGGSGPAGFENVNGTAFFRANDGAGQELWKATIEGPPAPTSAPAPLPAPGAKKKCKQKHKKRAAEAKKKRCKKKKKR